MRRVEPTSDASKVLKEVKSVDHRIVALPNFYNAKSSRP